MAQSIPSIFNQRATERLRSPDDLDKYVQVTNPSVWVVLAACVSLLVGLLSWGVFGSVNTNVAATGAVVDGRAVCFLAAEDAARVHVGDEVNVAGNMMEVSQISAIPLSREEARGLLDNDYLMATVFGGDWAYEVILSGDTSGLAFGVPIPMSITTERVAPISLVLGGK